MSNQTSSLVFLRYLTTAFDNIKDAVLLIGIEKGEIYRLLLANRIFHEISGFPVESIGREISEIVNPESFDFVTTKYRKVKKFKRSLEYTHWARVPAGRRAFEVQMIPVMNTVDEVVQIIVITRDVTAFANLKAEVQELRAQLAAKALKA